VPPFHAAVPRQAQPGQVLETTDARGVRRAITADANGIVWPTSAADVELADVYRLPALTSWGSPDEATADAETDEADEATADAETDDTGADAGQED
jgi:hypothetical protein